VELSGGHSVPLSVTHYPGASMVSDQVTTVRVPLTGWLQKRRSTKERGGVRRFLKSSNRRFFTLDFEAQMFYYSLSEGNKNLSMQACFAQLLSVNSLAAAATADVQEALEPDSAGNQSPKAISKSAAALHMMPLPSHAIGRTCPGFSGYARRSTELHGFVVKLKERALEVVCSSMEEADMWIAGLNDAIALSKSCPLPPTTPIVGWGSLEDLGSASNSDLSTTPPSSQTSPRSSSRSTNETEQATLMQPVDGKRHEFPPMAPDHGHVCGKSQQETPPQTPSCVSSLRATAGGAANSEDALDVQNFATDCC